MAKTRSDSFKGAPVLGELAAIADGHQLHAVPTDSSDCVAIREYKHKGRNVFAPNGDIMPQLEMLPWMVDFVDFIQKVVTNDGNVFEFMREHELTIVAGHFWKPAKYHDDELHSMCLLRLGQTTIEVNTWLKTPEKDSTLPYVSQQLIQIGEQDSRATFWVADTDDPAQIDVVVKRMIRTIRHYEDWEDPETACERTH